MVVPGGPDKSELYEALRTGRMPPETPLSRKEMALIRDWIGVGAPTTPEESAAIEARQSHPRNPHLPPGPPAR